jgi:hypothetical protein
MGAMASRPPPPPPLMMMSSMGPPRLPETLGPTAAQAQRSVISTPFPPGRPLPYLPGDVSLCKYYVHFLLLELLQLFTSHQIRTGADRRLCISCSNDSARDVRGHEFCTRLEYVNSQDFQLHNLADGKSYITYCPFHACMYAVQSSVTIHIRNHEYFFQLCILLTT